MQNPVVSRIVDFPLLSPSSPFSPPLDGDRCRSGDEPAAR